MNPLYEPFPDYVIVNEKKVRIVTDFREYIKLMDLLKDEDVGEVEKKQLLACWFLDDPGPDFEECLQALTDFVINYKETKASEGEEDNNEEDTKHNQVISYN